MKTHHIISFASRFGLFPHLGYYTRKLASLRLMQTAGLLAILGITICLWPNSTWSKLSFGLAFPGMGFSILPLGPALMLWGVSLCLMLGSLFLWFASGNIIAPAMAWATLALVPSVLPAMGSALIAAQWQAPIIISLSTVAFLAAFLLHMGSENIKNRDTRKPSRCWPVQESSLEPIELSPKNLARTRVLLDRALQPLDEFQGFEGRDQFQTAALRYQLQFAGYALAFVQHCATPAFKGYLHLAQSNLIEKSRNPKVWSYWKWQAFWGQFSPNRNPMARDNIMFTGFTASQMALFAGASGDEHFCEDGAFTLIDKKAVVYPASFQTMTTNLKEQYVTSRLGLIACEPNWVFPLCNAIGLVGLCRHLSHTKPFEWPCFAERMERLFQTEFQDRKGNFITCRSSHFGFAMPHIGGAATKALPSFFLNASLPRLAHSNWTQQRDEIFEACGEDLKIKLGKIWPIDVGNYRLTRISGLASIAATARELGDTMAADALLQKLEELHPSTIEDGRFHRRHSSNWSHAMELIAHVGQVNSLQKIAIAKPDFDAPHLADCPLEVAQVALARRTQNGLKIVLSPTGSDKQVKLCFAGLEADSNWHMQTAEETIYLQADAEGHIVCNVPLSQRIELEIIKLPNSQ